MTQRDRDLDDILRRALHTAAESVEPADDGLERIRARLSPPRPLLVAWVMAGYAAVARHTVGALSSVSAWLQSVPGAVRGHTLEHARRSPWRLHPIAALGMAAFVIVAGVIALTPVSQQAMQQTASLIHSLSGGPPSGPGGTSGGGVNGQGTGPASGAASQAGTAPSTAGQQPASSAACTSAPKPAACPSAAAGASTTACPSSAGAPPSTPGPSATPSTTPSGGAGPASCASTAASSPPTGTSSPSPTTTPTPTPTTEPPATPSPSPASPSPATSVTGGTVSSDPSAGSTP
jgi:hypothetical protein